MRRHLLRCLVVSGLFLGCGGNSFQGDAGTGGAAGAGIGGSGVAGSIAAAGAAAGGAPGSAGAFSAGAPAGGAISSGGAIGSGGATNVGGTGGSSAGSNSRGGTGGSGGFASAGRGGTSAGGTGGIVDPRCPAHAPPVASTCNATTLTCQYTYGSYCLCTKPAGTYFCQQVDPSCAFMPIGTAGASSFAAAPIPLPAGGANGAAVALPPTYTCSCTNNSWACNLGP